MESRVKPKLVKKRYKLNKLEIELFEPLQEDTKEEENIIKVEEEDKRKELASDAFASTSIFGEV